MSKKVDRGTKRTCPGCGVRFYDLNRDPVKCPSCSRELQLQAGPSSGETAAADKVSEDAKTAKKVAPKPILPPVDPDAPETEEDAALETLNGDDDEAIAIDDGDDETFMPDDDDDGADVSGIISPPKAAKEDDDS